MESIFMESKAFLIIKVLLFDMPANLVGYGVHQERWFIPISSCMTILLIYYGHKIVWKSGLKNYMRRIKHHIIHGKAGFFAHFVWFHICCFIAIASVMGMAILRTFIATMIYHVDFIFSFLPW